MQFVDGGVCAAKGFSANGIHCGMRRNVNKRDLALIKSDVPASAAAVYTQSAVRGAPLELTRRHLLNGVAQAIVCNSGNANTCNQNGPAAAREVCAAAANALGIAEDDVVVASTGVIGKTFDSSPILNGMDSLAAGLSYTGGEAAAEAILTTDLAKKQVAVQFELSGKTCTLGGIAKGSGMVHPNMATILVFITSDVSISPQMLQRALSHDVRYTFNMTSVDGDTSTNDMAVVLANGLAGNETIECEGEDFSIFMKALNTVTVALCRMIAGDGEGATKLLECVVTGALSEHDAQTAAKSVVCSSLVKAAMFGCDANWGRVLCVVGYCGITADMKRVDVRFSSKAGEVLLCKNGAAVNFDEEKALEILKQDEVDILVDLNMGLCDATAWGCDLSYDYVRISGGYRRQ